MDIGVYIIKDYKMAKFNFHPAASRGQTDLGWLKSHHSFSFGGYTDVNKMHFGALRVLNDDMVTMGMGFSPHRHENMEIISILLSGELAHSDSMGNGSVITKGDIQVMSAGSGIEHSEFNHSKTTTVEFLQIWVIPNLMNIEPRYDQQAIDFENATNCFLQIVSPNKNDSGVSIQQDAWFYWSIFESGFEREYVFKNNINGLYIFVLSGKIEVCGQELATRDGLEILGSPHVHIKATSQAEFLLMEVPI